MTSPSNDILERISKEQDVVQKARLIEHSFKEQQYSLREIAQYLNRHPSYVSHLLRLIKLPELVLDGYYSHTITLAHLIVLSRLQTEEDIIEAYKKVLADNLTSSQTEILIREMKFHVDSTDDWMTQKEIQDITRAFKKKYPNAALAISQTRVKGKIKIEVDGDTKATTEFIRSLMNVLAPEEKKEEVYVLE